MADPAARAALDSKAAVVDDAAVLSDADKFRSWLAAAPETQLDAFVEECVPGAMRGIDYGARGKPLECMEGVSEEDLKQTATEPVLRVLREHLEGKRRDASSDMSEEARVKLLAQLYKVAAAADDNTKALSLARERLSLVYGTSKEATPALLDAYYDAIIAEMRLGLVEDAARHANDVVTKYFPRDDWELDVANWIRFRLLMSHAKLRRGNVWGAHEPMQECAAVMFRWCGEKKSPEGEACPIQCHALGVSCNPCKFILDYFLYTDNLVFNGVMTKYDKFALTDQEQANLAAFSPEAKSLQLTDEDRAAMAAFRQKLADIKL